nr:immunoglobulin light chain junction region [Macaca mulatta]MOX54124.1 immunoglobulin light chain junction region [Macaca mulatta]MOX55057.1 immunoglobulin light chain junction region [Macaca mulatta]MOX55081.1 immunoglobulin light chain junction region [Macaca mulatta]MOX55556.1 immunoglobulin light chain junction region [Macaca mulatta]
CQHYYGFPRTF